MSTIDLTIIAPYYNDEKYLTIFFKDFIELKKTYKNLKLGYVFFNSKKSSKKDVKNFSSL